MHVMWCPTSVLNWSLLIWMILLSHPVRLTQSDDPSAVNNIPSSSTQQKQIQNDDTAEVPEEQLPYFDNTTLITNLTVQQGTDVSFSCRVNQLGDKVVSWMKRDEKGILKLLTYGHTTYSSDARQSLYFEKPNNWKLSIRTAQRSDSGQYQCQTSTHPPIILHFTLSVVVGSITIVDDGEKPLKDKIFKTGSTLECIVGSIDPDISQQHVNWYHGSRLLNNDTYRGGISVKSWLRKEFGHSKTSKLYVANVNRNDSGLYTCSMGRFGNASVYVSVGEEGVGETPAAMQHGSANNPLPASFTCTLIIFYILDSFINKLTIFRTIPIFSTPTTTTLTTRTSCTSTSM